MWEGDGGYRAARHEVGIGDWLLRPEEAVVHIQDIYPRRGNLADCGDALEDCDANTERGVLKELVQKGGVTGVMGYAEDNLFAIAIP